jgi:hypothetical protein
MIRLFHKLQDFITVLRGAWFLFLFDILAVFAFLVIAQGQDMLLVITENTAKPEQLWQLAGLLIALGCWCVSAEFGARMLVYLTDNSGKSLAPERVDDRKTYQRYVARCSLFFPVAVLLTAFSKVYFVNHGAMEQYKLASIGGATLIIIILLLAEAAFLWWLYPGGLIKRLTRKFHWLTWMEFSGEGKDWAEKLYGILNDVRIDIPTADHYGKTLPRGVELPNGMTLPKSPDVVADPDNFQTTGNVSVWMYQIKSKFYGNLIKQLIVLVLLALVTIVLIGLFLSVGADNKLGGCAIICLAFGAWTTVYVFLHFLDKAQPIPVRFLLIIWLVICSFINNDHPVRLLTAVPAKRDTLVAHFGNWLNRAQKDTLANSYYRIGKADSIPVIFISAEGGALRTGAFTGLLLAQLQEKYPMFSNYVYAYSSVSGGTVGASFFNAQLIRNNYTRQDSGSWHTPAIKFFEYDFMSAVTAKLVFGEILNYFWPRDLGISDRAIAIEQAYEAGWQNAYPNDPSNLMKGNFDVANKAGLPALFINTTEVETGLQNVWSNVNLKGIPLYWKRDLYQIQGTPIRYSSAINLSDRFPLISPAGEFTRPHTGKDSTRHFVDGGYYENKGSETLLQVLQVLHLAGRKIKPYVLQFNFSGDTAIHSVSKFNEISEITGAIYNTRGGRGQIAQDALQKYVESLHGVFIPLTLKLNENELPMNWVLSRTVVERLDQTLELLVDPKHWPANDKLMDPKDKPELQKLFLYDPTNIRRKVTFKTR